MALFDKESVRRVHCIGIGGIGVSALAEILIRQGFEVSGSDAESSERLLYLQAMGADVHVSHQEKHAIGADLVVYSSAISPDNPEFSYAKAHNIPTMQRGQLLADIMRLYFGVSVTGTHGKTTTTALLAHICSEAGLDPTYFIGGIPSGKSSPVHLGRGDAFIAEADESDASFLYMQSKLAIVTNIECDHMGTYADSEEMLRQSFVKFLSHVDQNGAIVLCRDDENIRKIAPSLTCKAIYYGTDVDADYAIQDYRQNGLLSSANLRLPEGKIELILNLPGLYNMKNAVAASVAAHHMGVDWPTIVKACASFCGVGRRFQALGSVKLDGKSVQVFEDYGHHPTEVNVAYRAAKVAFPEQRVVLVFQPHRYTRTRDLMDEFTQVLNTVDALVLLPTYAASEAVIQAATSHALFQHLALTTATCLESESTLQLTLASLLQDQDILLFQGAGDVSAMAKMFVEK